MSKEKHFIGMAGLHGCMPNYCGVYDTYDDAVDGLSDIHELGRGRRALLQQNSYLELRNDGDAFPFINDGNEYCEIVDCDCDTPEIHQD